MNIVVCIKQVPDTGEVRIDLKTNTIRREGIKSIINPLDLCALEEGIRIREKVGIGKVSVFSMGIPSVCESIRDTIAFGAGEGILLSDKAFAGADTLATAYTLSKGIQRIKDYRLIICGKQAIDGDTAQVGPSLADKLGIPHITNVRRIEEINNYTIKCRRLTEYGEELIEMKLPGLITVTKDINEPRVITLKGMMKARKTDIVIWNAEDIDADKSKCGIQGSPTYVVRTFEATYDDIESEIFNGCAEEQAQKLVERLMSSNKYVIRR